MGPFSGLDSERPVWCSVKVTPPGPDTDIFPSTPMSKTEPVSSIDTVYTTSGCTAGTEVRGQRSEVNIAVNEMAPNSEVQSVCALFGVLISRMHLTMIRYNDTRALHEGYTPLVWRPL